MLTNNYIEWSRWAREHGLSVHNTYGIILITRPGHWMMQLTATAVDGIFRLIELRRCAGDTRALKLDVGALLCLRQSAPKALVQLLDSLGGSLHRIVKDNTDAPRYHTDRILAFHAWSRWSENLALGARVLRTVLHSTDSEASPQFIVAFDQFVLVVTEHDLSGMLSGEAASITMRRPGYKDYPLVDVTIIMQHVHAGDLQVLEWLKNEAARMQPVTQPYPHGWAYGADNPYLRYEWPDGTGAVPTDALSKHRHRHYYQPSPTVKDAANDESPYRLEPVPAPDNAVTYRVYLIHVTNSRGEQGIHARITYLQGSSASHRYMSRNLCRDLNAYVTGKVPGGRNSARAAFAAGCSLFTEDMCKVVYASEPMSAEHATQLARRKLKDYTENTPTVALTQVFRVTRPAK